MPAGGLFSAHPAPPARVAQCCSLWLTRRLAILGRPAQCCPVLLSVVHTCAHTRHHAGGGRGRLSNRPRPSSSSFVLESPPPPYDNNALSCETVQATTQCRNDTYSFPTYCFVLLRTLLLLLWPAAVHTTPSDDPPAPKSPARRRPKFPARPHLRTRPRGRDTCPASAATYAWSAADRPSSAFHPFCVTQNTGTLWLKPRESPILAILPIVYHLRPPKGDTQWALWPIAPPGAVPLRAVRPSWG